MIRVCERKVPIRASKGRPGSVRGRPGYPLRYLGSGRRREAIWGRRRAPQDLTVLWQTHSGGGLLEVIVIGKLILERKKGRPHTPNFIWYLSILRRARRCPDLPGLARTCPAWRSHPGPFQLYSSRASAQDDARWQRQTPSNYSFLPRRYPRLWEAPGGDFGTNEAPQDLTVS